MGQADGSHVRSAKNVLIINVFGNMKAAGSLLRVCATLCAILNINWKFPVPKVLTFGQIEERIAIAW